MLVIIAQASFKSMLLLPRASHELGVHGRTYAAHHGRLFRHKRTEELTHDTERTKLKNITRRSTSQSQKFHIEELARMGNFEEEESESSPRTGGDRGASPTVSFCFF